MKGKGTEGSFSCALFLSGKSAPWMEGRTEGQMDGWVGRWKNDGMFTVHSWSFEDEGEREEM